MPESVSVRVVGTIDDQTFTQVLTATGDVIVRATPTVPVAKTGTLTTRTDNDTGVLTMTAGHGFITNDKIDVFWSGGKRRNMTATVATNAVTVDGGTGDNLPALSTAVTAMKPTEVVVAAFNGADVVGLGVSAGSAQGFVVFKDDAAAIITAAAYALDANRGETWVSDLGTTNPLGTSDVASVLFSHGSSTAEQTMTALVVTDGD